MGVTRAPLLITNNILLSLNFGSFSFSVFDFLFQCFSTFDVLYKETYMNLQFAVLLAKKINILLSKSFYT